MKEIFTEIYHSNAWGSTESRSGPGSVSSRAQTLGREILNVIERLDVATMLDAPCGDYNWLKEVSLPLGHYTGIDVVEEIIAANQLNYGQARRIFEVKDLTSDLLPKSDLILCRDCLVHFSFADIFRALANFRASGSTYLLSTTFQARHENSDIATGGWRTLNLCRAPFCFPTPEFSVSDWCPDPSYADKRLGLWKIESLPVL